MKTSDAGIALIKKFEGCRLTSYKAVSTERYYTIGYGHYGADVKKGMCITQQTADKLLVQDLSKFENSVNKILDTYDLNQNQYDALVSFTYNCGYQNLLLLTANKTRTLSQISEKLLLYNKSGGKVLDGLTRRRKAEKALFDTPVKEKTITDIAKEVLAGKWGNGLTRKAKLEKAGYNYKEVQQEVNRLLKGGK